MQRPVAVELELLVLRLIAAEDESLGGHLQPVPAAGGLLALRLRGLGRGRGLRRIELGIVRLLAQRGAQVLDLRFLREGNDVGGEQQGDEQHVREG